MSFLGRKWYNIPDRKIENQMTKFIFLYKICKTVFTKEYFRVIMLNVDGGKLASVPVGR